MAYQNIARPRIYINLLEFVESVGIVALSKIYRTLPVIPETPPFIEGTNAIHLPDLREESYFKDMSTQNPYLAVLGHDYQSFTFSDAVTSIINGEASNTRKGFSIFGLNKPFGNYPSYSHPAMEVHNGSKIGSIVYGVYYDFPIAPDLSVSLEYNYEGFKETTTLGGNTLSNQYYTKPTAWGDLGCWELEGGTPFNKELSKSGRRIWNLSFTMTDAQIYPDNAALTNEDSSDYTRTLLKNNTLQRMLHLTQGGNLPFIFQSDSKLSKSSPQMGQLAICKIDQKSFVFQQTSPTIYSVKMKIKEIW